MTKVLLSLAFVAMFAGMAVNVWLPIEEELAYELSGYPAPATVTSYPYPAPVEVTPTATRAAWKDREPTPTPEVWRIVGNGVEVVNPTIYWYLDENTALVEYRGQKTWAQRVDSK